MRLGEGLEGIMKLEQKGKVDSSLVLGGVEMYFMDVWVFWEYG